MSKFDVFKRLENQTLESDVAAPAADLLRLFLIESSITITQLATELLTSLKKNEENKLVVKTRTYVQLLKEEVSIYMFMRLHLNDYLSDEVKQEFEVYIKNPSYRIDPHILIRFAFEFNEFLQKKGVTNVFQLKKQKTLEDE